MSNFKINEREIKERKYKTFQYKGDGLEYGPQWERVTSCYTGEKLTESSTQDNSWVTKSWRTYAFTTPNYYNEAKVPNVIILCPRYLELDEGRYKPAEEKDTAWWSKLGLQHSSKWAFDFQNQMDQLSSALPHVLLSQLVQTAQALSGQEEKFLKAIATKEYSWRTIAEDRITNYNLVTSGSAIAMFASIAYMMADSLFPNVRGDFQLEPALSWEGHFKRRWHNKQYDKETTKGIRAKIEKFVSYTDIIEMIGGNSQYQSFKYENS